MSDPIHMFSDEQEPPMCPTCGEEVTDVPFITGPFGAVIAEGPFEAECIDGHNPTYQYDEAWDV